MPSESGDSFSHERHTNLNHYKLDLTVNGCFDVHHYHHSDVAANEEVLSLLREIKSQGVKIMALIDDLQAGIAALNAETTLVGERIAALVAKLSNESLTPEQKTQVLAAMTAEAERLKTLAVDTTVPVPPAPPDLVQARRR